MTTNTFDPYEYIAIIAPGAVVGLGLATEWPELRSLLADRGLTVGGLGLFLVLSFVLGHVTQAVGNLVEGIVWRAFGGMPSHWVKRPEQTLISAQQRQRLLQRLEQDHGPLGDPAAVGKQAWDAIVREIYTKVNKANRSQRTDAFNRTYGLLRGLCAAFLLLAVLLALAAPAKAKLALVAVAAAGAAGYRMYRFGRNYARELFIEYAGAPMPSQAQA